MSFKVRRGPASDHLDSVSLVRKAHQIKKIRSLDADKGYTQEKLRMLVVEECLAEDRIKVKNPEVPIWRTRGRYLKKAKRRKLRANYRALCETYHSVLKRVTGSMVRAVKVSMQNREVAFKVLACSALRRAISSFIHRTFLLGLLLGLVEKFREKARNNHLFPFHEMAPRQSFHSVHLKKHSGLPTFLQSLLLKI